MTNTTSNLAPKLSLGPVQYYWDRERMFEFYRGIAKSPVDIVYLGETVCAKRKLLRRDDWLTLAKMLKDAGKEVVLSTMTLIEANSELASLTRLCSSDEFMLEANDMSAVHQLSGKSFVTGPAINIYNPETLKVLARLGLKRWVMPLELSKFALADLQKEKPENIETEVFVYGRLPLAYSARCFTARAYNQPKDDCQYRCLDYPDGLLLSTQEDEKFLVLNGVQTQSAKTCNLITELQQLKNLNVDVLRISPPSQHCEKIIEKYSQCLLHDYPVEEAAIELNALMPDNGSCNGYWHGTNGMDWVAENQEATCLASTS